MTKTFFQLNEEIKKYHKQEFKSGNITRGFTNESYAKAVRTMMAKHYDLNEVNLRNLRDVVVMSNVLSNKESYDPLSSDCMGATTYIIDSMLANLGCEV